MAAAEKTDRRRFYARKIYKGDRGERNGREISELGNRFSGVELRDRVQFAGRHPLSNSFNNSSKLDNTAERLGKLVWAASTYLSVLKRLYVGKAVPGYRVKRFYSSFSGI